MEVVVAIADAANHFEGAGVAGLRLVVSAFEGAGVTELPLHFGLSVRVADCPRRLKRAVQNLYALDGAAFRDAGLPDAQVGLRLAVSVADVVRLVAGQPRSPSGSHLPFYEGRCHPAVRAARAARHWT